MPASPSNKEAKLEEEEIYETVLDHNSSVSIPHQYQIPCTNTCVSPQLAQEPATKSKSFPGKTSNECGGKVSGGYGQTAKCGEAAQGIGDPTASAKQYQSLLQMASTEVYYTSRKI